MGSRNNYHNLTDSEGGGGDFYDCPETILIVPDFCVRQLTQFSLVLGLILSSFLSLSISLHPAVGMPKNMKRKQKSDNEVEREKIA